MKRREFVCALSCLVAGGLLYSHFHNFQFDKQEQNVESDKPFDKFKLYGFTVAPATHCNLCCKGCDTYAPLAKKEFLDYDQYVKDLKKLVKLAPDRHFDIGFLGGEPLLNPEMTKILKVSSMLVPQGHHAVLTNGILLNTIEDEFWEVLKKYNIDLFITKYPINLDRSIYEKKAEKYGIKCNYHYILDSKYLYDMETHEIIGDNPDYSSANWKWDKNIVDVKGEQDYIEKKNSCGHWGKRFSLYHRGNIYYCPVHSYISLFMEYFNIPMEITKDDYIKVADVKDIKEIDDFLAAPKPLCRYCKRCHDSCFGGKTVEWGFSKRDISEWT